MVLDEPGNCVSVVPESLGEVLKVALLRLKESTVNSKPQPKHHPSSPHVKHQRTIDLTAASEDDEPTPKRVRTSQSVSTLQLSGSTFDISSDSLQKLQPSGWLNDEIVVGALRLIADASHRGVLVADSTSLILRRPGRYSKVLLPILIRQNHWVLAVYNRARVLVYDSLPIPTASTENEVSQHLHHFFSKTLQIDTLDHPAILITSPLQQKNGFDCGVLSIVAGFCEALDIRVPPEIDAPFLARCFASITGTTA
ncbi:hypothetical protein B0T16DRAFT_890 [Cercophora newfieldiana]|uniref:Ubiquitin-like protease family profile domain-containing protein n=1 Tax=Cercophora newfieldiana TaxID=92897 RepID=A0AA39YLJ4_9PEZI|nr:hypothetical protein B0T16DRAFT_890 [Cercophora newfieldiana]